jgi:hypothetical protein
MPFPEVKPRLAFSWIVASWGEVREFEPGADKSLILEWIESELFRLSGQSSA